MYPTQAIATARFAARSSGDSRAGRDVVLEIEVVGAREVKRQMPEAVLVFIAPPAVADLEARLRGRGTDSPEEISDRLEIARREMEAQPEFDHVIVNDDAERAADRTGGADGLGS